ncbi:DEAD/DEAH box helicase family protein, partial [Ruminococcus flavefaciens]|uniref:DEAD/DEAH box helicase family protein n=1 Tax=Ruminococcus flavefaciens TaxID=1265 RepID=UPI0026EF1CA0
MRNVADELENIVNNVMSGLKDFQKKTVEHIDLLYRSGQKRILVSDEVGLGKTLIARGTIAKVAKLRQEEGDELVKVAYICSNSTIADQNLRKLRITSEVQTDDAGSSRLSMQHLKIFEQESDPDLHQRYIQLIPLTPDTSFRMTTGSGTVSERALMFAVLRRMPALKNFLLELEVLMADRAISAWHYWCRNYYMERVENCNKLSKNAYLDFMMKQLDREMNMEREGERSYLDILKAELKKIRNGLSYDRGIIGRLRHMFAEISVARLEPDLVIMDEFQR